MRIYPRSLLAFIRAILNRPTRLPHPGVIAERRAMRQGLITAMVEEAANVRIYYGCDTSDFALWETEPAVEPRRRSSDA